MSTLTFLAVPTATTSPPNPHTHPSKQIEPVPSSVLLSSLIPTVLGLVYVAIGLYKLYPIISRHTSWKGVKEQLANYARCVGSLGWIRIRSLARRRKKEGYETVHASGNEEGVDLERRYQAEEQTSSESRLQTERSLLPRLRIDSIDKNIDDSINNNKSDYTNTNDDNWSQRTVTSQADIAVVSPTTRRRRKPAPLLLHPHSQPIDRGNRTTSARTLNISRFFDPESGRLKDYIIRRPATGLEELCEPAPRPDTLRGNGTASVEWMIECFVAWLQRWFEEKTIPGGGGYQLVPEFGNDDDNDIEMMTINEIDASTTETVCASA